MVQAGYQEGGYTFNGGDAGDNANWSPSYTAPLPPPPDVGYGGVQPGYQQGGYTFNGGDAGLDSSWSKIDPMAAWASLYSSGIQGQSANTQAQLGETAQHNRATEAAAQANLAFLAQDLQAKIAEMQYEANLGHMDRVAQIEAGIEANKREQETIRRADFTRGTGFTYALPGETLPSPPMIQQNQQMYSPLPPAPRMA